MFSSIDFQSKNVKYIVVFVASFILFAILAPGTLFEINPTSDKKVELGRKTPIVTVVVHGVIFSAVMFALYWFYLGKMNQSATI